MRISCWQPTRGSPGPNVLALLMLLRLKFALGPTPIMAACLVARLRSRSQDETRCSRSHTKTTPQDFDHAAMALMAGREGHWALLEVKGYAARQQLATGYALAHRAHRDGRQLSTRNEVITAGQATRHQRALGGVLSVDDFSQELEEDYHTFGYLSVLPWALSGVEPDDV